MNSENKTNPEPRKRILIIGNADSVWVKDYCEYVLKSIDSDVFILSSDNSRFQDYYRLNHIKVCLFPEGKKVISGKKLCKIMHESKFDYVHVQFGSRFNIRAALAIKRHTKQVIVTFWGSDLLRLNWLQAIELSLYLPLVDRIIVLTHNMLDSMQNNHLLRRFCKKVTIQDFGINILEQIDLIESEDVIAFKQKRGIPQDAVTIGVGYNKSEGQQHLAVIDSVAASLPSILIDKVFFVFQMTYGNCSASYFAELIDILRRNKMRYVIIEGFLDSEDVATLRKSIDIYINAQITDALAATINEYLYAGAIVLNPAWLKYDELKSIGVIYNTYDSIESIPKALCSELDRLQMDSLAVKKNKELIRNHYSWGSIKHKWINLYD